MSRLFSLDEFSVHAHPHAKEIYSFAIPRPLKQRDLNIVMPNGYIDMSPRDALHSIGYLSNQNADIILGPEYYLSSLPLDRQSKETIVEILKELTKGKDTLLIPGSMMWGEDDSIKNTAFVISDGKVLLEYDKITLAQSDEMIAGQLGLYPVSGSRKGLFRWNGDPCGIGICADYRELSYNFDGFLDLQFLISGDAYLDVENEYIIVSEGGHLIRCDSKLQKQEIKTKTKDGFITDYHMPSKTDDSGTIHHRNMDFL